MSSTVTWSMVSAACLPGSRASPAGAGEAAKARMARTAIVAMRMIVPSFRWWRIIADIPVLTAKSAQGSHRLRKRRGSVLDEGTQPAERVIPLRRDQVEIGTRLGDRLRPVGEAALAADADAADQPDMLQHVQV